MMKLTPKQKELVTWWLVTFGNNPVSVWRSDHSTQNAEMLSRASDMGLTDTELTIHTFGLLKEVITAYENSK